MFNKLKIKNFQSLKDVELELGQITVLSGPSNLGKSAVVRALDCLTHNNYTEAYMRRGAQTLRVSLEEDGNSVQFNRDGKTSTYTTNFLAPVYEKIAGNVPEDISRFLNMDPLTIDDLSKDLNFSFQFDGPFLLDSSGFDVGKILGRLIQLESVVGATRQISNDSASTKKEVEHLIRAISENEAYLSSNGFILEKKQLSDRLRDLSTSCKVIEDKCQKIEQILSRLDSLSAEEGVLSSKLDALTSLKEVDIDRIKTLSSLLDTVSKDTSIYSSYKGIIETLNVDVFDTKNLEALNSIISVLKTEVMRMNELKGAVERASSNLDSKKEEFSNYIKNNPICPLTKKPFSSECMGALCEVDI